MEGKATDATVGSARSSGGSGGGAKKKSRAATSAMLRLMGDLKDLQDDPPEV